MLSYVIGNKIDILMISESKLDDTFPTPQFVIDSFVEHFKLDHTKNGGVILLFVKNNITATVLTNYTLPEDMKTLFVEIVIKRIKWLFCCSYNPYKTDNLPLTRNSKRFGISKKFGISLQIMRKYC